MKQDKKTGYDSFKSLVESNRETPTPSPSIHEEWKFTKDEWIKQDGSFCFGGLTAFSVIEKDYPICYVLINSGVTRKQAEANAALIAESKNMYLALKEMIKAHEDGGQPFYNDECENAKAILNRIK